MFVQSVFVKHFFVNLPLGSKLNIIYIKESGFRGFQFLYLLIKREENRLISSVCDHGSGNSSTDNHGSNYC